MKRPSFQFYPGDWLEDIGLRASSLAARGLWIDMLCFMHQGEPYGHLRKDGRDVTTDQVARMVGESLRKTSRLLEELEANHVFSRMAKGTIYSRRQVRDEVFRQKRAKWGEKGGTAAFDNPRASRPGEPRQGGRPISKEGGTQGGNKRTPLVPPFKGVSGGNRKTPPSSPSPSPSPSPTTDHQHGGSEASGTLTTTGNGPPAAASSPGVIPHDPIDPVQARIVARCYDLAAKGAALELRTATDADVREVFVAVSGTPKGKTLDGMLKASPAWLEETLRACDRFEEDLVGAGEVPGDR